MNDLETNSRRGFARIDLLVAIVLLAEAVAVADQRGDETLKFFLSKSHVVVVGKITSTPLAISGSRSVPIFVCDFQVNDVLKGDAGLKGKTIMLNIIRIEMDKKDHHPLIKKNAECILFLKERKAKRGPWETADVWFGVQHPSTYMAKSLKRLAEQEVVEQRDPADTVQEIRTVGDALSSLKSELVSMSADYPELAGARDIRVNEDGFEYRHNCRFMGKRGYEDTGRNAVAIGLRTMSMQQFRVDVKRVAMQGPSCRWPSLEMVGWPILYIRENPSPGLSARLNKVLTKHCEMIDELDQVAGRLPHRERRH